MGIVYGHGDLKAPWPERLIAAARARYVRGLYEVEDLERDLELILFEGKVPHWAVGGTTPFRQPAMKRTLT